MKNKLRKLGKYNILCAVLFMFFILPYMGVILYTLPRNDEFSAAFSIYCHGGYSLKGLIECVKTIYMTWEGNYSGVFLYTMLNPVVIGNYDSTVYTMNFVCFTLFVVLWTYYIYRVLSWFGISKGHKKVLAVVTLIISINCRFMRETLGWFTGYMYYTIQLLLGIAGIFIVWNIIDHKLDKKYKDIILLCIACLFEIIGAGGTLHVSAILCFFILVFLIWIIYSKREWIKAAILFGTIFIATLVNVLAPGHYVRKGGYEPVSLVGGIVYTVVCVYNEVKRLCVQTVFPYVMLAMFVVLFAIIKEQKESKFLNPIVVFIAGICCILGTSFPVCYGYGESSMASRGYEIMDLLVVFWSVLFLCSLVNWLIRKKVVFSTNYILMICIFSAFMFTTVAIDKVEFLDIPFVQCWRGLADGSIKDYSDYWRDVLHQIENADGGDVVIQVKSEYLDKECIIDRCMFREDPTNWVNDSLAQYYGYSSIRLERID